MTETEAPAVEVPPTDTMDAEVETPQTEHIDVKCEESGHGTSHSHQDLLWALKELKPLM